MHTFSPVIYQIYQETESCKYVSNSNGVSSHICVNMYPILIEYQAIFETTNIMVKIKCYYAAILNLVYLVYIIIIILSQITMYY